jgi:aminopeptidase YwaD
LANETIVVGAHYDHLGHGERDSLAPEARRGQVHPGADDNASGVAAVMELARRFAARGTPPQRRLVFVAFSGEESGQLGSRHYVKHPIGDTVAMLNFDMVGRLRDDRLGIAGNESAREFAALLAAADGRSPLEVMLGGPEYPDDSDHGPFAAAGVPILYLCTGGHEDRHMPDDTADKVNFEGMAKVVDFSEDLLDRLQASPRPKFVPPPALDGDRKAK